MDFSYTVSEKQYFRALKLRLKVGSRFGVPKTIMFWVFVLGCLMMVWRVVERSSQVPPAAEYSTPETSEVGHPLHSTLVNTAPFALMAGFWALLAFGFLPMRVRRMYRSDPLMQGQFTVSITQEGIATKNTAGTSSNSGWNVYEHWRERKAVIILCMRSGTYFILGLTGLSEAQRTELRGLLAGVLPKK